jgi:glycosyltransferase involved in cell wall biosynthesis
MSELGFIRTFAVFNDFVFAPLTPRLARLLHNLSILLENAPVVRAFAGSILVHAQNPPRATEPRAVSLRRHDCFRGAVSVVIPCRNEEANVRPLVEGLQRHYDDYLREIILVDDGSTDRTGEVIDSLRAEDPRVVGVTRQPPHGVGRALADGLRAARGGWILTLDCDFQHLLPDIRDLFDAAADGAEVAIGSRFSQRSVLLNYPFAKILANRAFHSLAKLLLRGDFHDLTNNLKLMRADVAADICIQEPGFAANAETGFLPLLAGRRVEEVPISWINRTPDMGSSSFHLVRVGGGYTRVLRHLALLRWFGRGRYADLPSYGGFGATRRSEPVAP